MIHLELQTCAKSIVLANLDGSAVAPEVGCISGNCKWNAPRRPRTRRHSIPGADCINSICYMAGELVGLQALFRNGLVEDVVWVPM